MLQGEKGFQSAKEIQSRVCRRRSCSWTAFRRIARSGFTPRRGPAARPFARSFRPDVAKKSPAQIEKWAEDYILRLAGSLRRTRREDRADVLGRGVWLGSGHRLSVGLLEGRRLRFHQRRQGTFCEEDGQDPRSTPTSSASSSATKFIPAPRPCRADDFNMLVEACDGDKCLGVNADPSHCWEGEDWETRFRKVGARIYACHVKNYVVRPGLPLRMMEPAGKSARCSSATFRRAN